jgi:hypothetical protein
MWFVGALLGVTMAVIGHAALCRAPVPLNGVTRFLLIGGLIGACLLSWLLYRYGVTTPQTWAAAAVYGFCCELYIFLFTFAMSSVTANLLARLSSHDMTDGDIEQFYDSRYMVTTRLDRLVAVALVDEGPGGLSLSPEGTRLVRMFHRLRGLFRHPEPSYSFPANN